MTYLSGNLHATRRHDSVLSQIASTSMAVHLPSPTNPEALTLCQEYAMRTGGYDDLALVGIMRESAPWRWGTSAPFAQIVDEHDGDLDAAIRKVHRCAWLSRDDFKSRESIPCTECAEVRSA